jgi:hypothetical protein
VIHDDAAGETRQNDLISFREVADDGGHVILELLRHALGEVPSDLGEIDAKDTSIL